MSDRQNTDAIPSNLRENAGKGRAKGVPNKVTQMAKEAIALAAEKLGGADRLTAWAQEDPKNERVFWGTIYPKLLPLQVTGEDGAPIRLEQVVSDADAFTRAIAGIAARGRPASPDGSTQH